MQYTLRSIPMALDAALRERARVEKKSLNEVAHSGHGPLLANDPTTHHYAGLYRQLR